MKCQYTLASYINTSDEKVIAIYIYISSLRNSIKRYSVIYLDVRNLFYRIQFQ